MPLDLTSALAGVPDLAEPQPRLLRATAAAKPSARPVLQLSGSPITLNPKEFTNPVSNAHPDGSLLTLYAFRQLVDPVPTLTREYSPNAISTESVYDNVVNGASIADAAPYARRVLSSAQQTFASTFIAPFDGSTIQWRPVIASPYDWFDTSQSARFRTVTMDLSSDAPPNAFYQLLNDGDTSLVWHIGDVQQPVESQIDSVTFQCLSVTLARPWMSLEFLGLNSWLLQGQKAGYVSTGTPDGNEGVLPLLPTQLLIGLDVSVATSKWSGQDQATIDIAASGEQPVSLGPFVLSAPEAGTSANVSQTSISASVLQVVGWLSTLVPCAPSIAG